MSEAMLASRTVEVDGWRMHLRVGAPAARNVVLLHGIPGSGRSWERLIPHLGNDLRPVVPDLLGFGHSDRPTSLADLHADGQAKRLGQALRACGVERPLLVGHDFGGPVALRLVMGDPDAYSGLVLVATNTFADTPIPFPLSLVNAPLLGGAAARLLFSRPALAGMCRFGARRARVDVEAAVGDASQAAAIRTIFAGSLSDLRGLYGPLEQLLPQLRIPTLVVWGDHDPFFPVAQAERTTRAIPGARLVVLEGCGHFLPEEAPERLAALVSEVARPKIATLEGGHA